MAYTIHPYSGLSYTVRSFMIVVLAGLGNLAGVFWAALGLGIAESFAGFILGPQYQIAFVFVLLVALLVLRNWRLKRKRLYLR
jgi:branched-chain amino acid transport system permease protein